MALVNFSIPNIPDFQKTTPDTPALFVPDIKYLVKFAQGDIGISDKIKMGMLTKNISKMTNLSQLETFMKATGATLPKSLDTYVKDGRVQINPDDLKLGVSSGDLGGIKAFEKSLIQSIFESQKPYIEIIKMVTESLIRVEDISARVLAVGGSSMNPVNNPRALGYGGGDKIQKSLFQIGALANIKKTPTQDNNSGILPSEYTYVTQSIIYSTGQFEPTVDYTYIYRDIKDDSISIPDGTSSLPSPTDDSGKPNVMVFGIYGSNWNPLPLSSIETPLGQPSLTGSVVKNVNWLNRSGKWFGEFSQIKSGVDYSYVRDGDGNVIYYNNEGPSVDTGGQTIYIKNGFPKLIPMGGIVPYYKNYYLEDTKLKLDNKPGLSQSIKDSALSEISKNLDTTDASGVTSIQTNIEGLLKNGFLPYTNGTNTPNSPSFTSGKYPYKPNKVKVSGTDIWIDPEAKYDMKIIKCDSSKDIKYYDIEQDPNTLKSTQIIRFVHNTLSIKLSNGDIFHYILTSSPNSANPEVTKGDVPEFIMDNINTSSSYSIDIRYNKVPEEYASGALWNATLSTVYLFSNDNGNYTIRYGYYVSGTFVEKSRNIGLLTFPNGKKLRFDSNGNFLYTEVYSSIIDSLLPIGLQKNNVIIDVSVTSKVDSANNFILTQNRSVIPPNQIRVKDTIYPFGKLISNTQIANEHLVTNKPYSKNGLYGTPTMKTQNIEQIYRYMITEDDTETYYIVEGILASSNKQKLNVSASSGNSSSGGGGGGDYSLPDVTGAIPVFIELIIDILTKLVPAIQQLMTLIKNPPKFITDIIIAKLGDNFGSEAEKFGFFSKPFLDDAKKLSQIKGSSSSNQNKINQMKDFIKNSRLKNYFHVNNLGEPRFILDGIAAIGLFGDAPMLSGLPGIKFGIETKIGSLASLDPKVPFNLVFNGPKPSSLKSIPDLSGMTSDDINRQVTPDSMISKSSLANTNFTPKLEVKNEIKTQVGDTISIEEVSMQYSTGIFKEGVDYTYIYVTEYVKKLIDDAQSYQDQGDLPKAISSLQEAARLDPQNNFIKDNLDQLHKISDGLGSQPILDFILNFVTLPIKVVFGIIKYIMDFFKSLTNPFELPGKIADFVSFKWMLDFFNPVSKNSMFAMAGLLFDIKTFLTVWLPSLESGSMNSFDLNKIIKLPWVLKLPTYNKKQFKSLIYGANGSKIPRMAPLMMLSSILSLIEGIMNGFIDFIWKLLGIEAIIPPPYINLSKDTNGNLSPKDIMDLLNGNYFSSDISSSGSAGVSSQSSKTNFVYEVKTSDGRDVKDLNQFELDKWMENNKELQFIFDV